LVAVTVPSNPSKVDPSFLSGDLTGLFWTKRCEKMSLERSCLKKLYRRLRAIASSITWQEIQLPARRINIELLSLEVKTFDEFNGAFIKATDAKVGAIYVLPAPIFVENEKRIADFAAKSRIPSVFHLPEFVRLGGLMAYGPDRADLFRRATTYVDKILKGANPGDLPVEQPTKFELVINLKTAKAIGVTVPPALLTRADEVIE
jgi:putative ABC transport system substrate-binding protein